MLTDHTGMGVFKAHRPTTNDQRLKTRRETRILKPATRIGYGWDSHEFKRGIPLKIGGIILPHPKGLGGHSDGDVLLHALTDALLGAVAAPDIGTLFSPSDQRWKGADSALFLAEALCRVEAAGYAVVNVDSTLVLAAPKIGPHAADIRAHVAGLLGILADCVGLKAKTPEGMGTDNAAIAHAVVLLEKIAAKPARPRKAKK
jgi:2-C-methyl-D-erythritol 2,4-cyclodiphosphate synthase